MSKWIVKLDFWEYVYDIEADNEQEAIKNALIKLTNDPKDYFTAEDHYANILLNNFENSCYAEEQDE